MIINNIPVAAKFKRRTSLHYFFLLFSMWDVLRFEEDECVVGISCRERKENTTHRIWSVCGWIVSGNVSLGWRLQNAKTKQPDDVSPNVSSMIPSLPLFSRKWDLLEFTCLSKPTDWGETSIY